jgi:hypothetical protein
MNHDVERVKLLCKSPSLYTPAWINELVIQSMLENM